MNSCFHKDTSNCKRGHICELGYECCSQKVPNGSNPTLGVCVKSGTCDVERGICSDKNKNLFDTITENFFVFSKEGYKNSNMFNKVVLTLSIVVILILISSLIYSLKRKMKI